VGGRKREERMDRGVRDARNEDFAVFAALSSPTHSDYTNAASFSYNGNASRKFVGVNADACSIVTCSICEKC
jgi:hypothetical protein